MIALSSIAGAQADDHPAAWGVSVSLGGYAVGNRGAVTHWLVHNGYGVTEPKHCGFDQFFRTICDPAVPYPRVSDSELLGWTVGVTHSLSDRVSIEVFGATEQSGSAVGRCDDLATPRDARCTERFMTVEFGGVSVASLGVVQAGRFHVGAGPAVLFANWDMSPSHLAGAWFDATYDAGRWPLFARAQYRFYQSASLSSQHFTGFHPSTFYVGVGFTISVDDSPH